jgi:cytochrome c oxidase cbb3-type subunit I/II
MTSESKPHWHRRWIEPSSGLMAVLTTIVVSIGGLVEIVPMFAHGSGPDAAVEVAPYTPLQLAGRDLYVREGCMTCHSQMVRPMRSETLRYGGEWSRAYEYQWDRPFLLGSRRIGPDLHRVGGKYPDAWHYEHLEDPRKTSPGSIMPVYPWLLAQSIDASDVQASMRALQWVGTPYTDDDIANAPAALEAEGRAIVARLAESNVQSEWDREVVAVIAYLQRLGDDRPAPVAANP